MAISTDVGVWISAILTILVYTYFIRNRQNIAFRFAQSTVIGAALGYTVVLVMAKNIDSLAISKISGGNWIPIIPLLIGLAAYARLYPRYSYLARIPVALVVAVGLGLGARASLDAEIFTQVIATAGLTFMGVDPFTEFSNIVFVVAVVAAVSYFFFTLKQKVMGRISPARTFGLYILMVYFGARFGSTILTRIGWLMGRLQFLLYTWLGLV